MRVYRIVVESWPTPDGEPWARYYGQGSAVPNHIIPAWLMERLETATESPWNVWGRTAGDRIIDRTKRDDADDIAGVLMPLPKRRNYLSAAGVSELAKDMRAFGAEVRVIASEPVAWREES